MADSNQGKTGGICYLINVKMIWHCEMYRYMSVDGVQKCVIRVTQIWM